MTNIEILDKLNKGACYDASECISLLTQFDKSESEFPIENLNTYVRFDRWNYEDFNFENEMFIKEFFPNYVLDIFFEVKDFKKNSRNELLEDQELFAKLYNLPNEDTPGLGVESLNLNFAVEISVLEEHPR